MNILVDPTIFFAFGRGMAPSKEDEALLQSRLNSLTQIVTSTGARIAFSHDHWRQLYKDFIDPAYAACSSFHVRTAIATVLRKRYRPVIPQLGSVRAWGFLPLLNTAGAKATYWADGLALSAAELLRSGERVVLFTGLDAGRNLTVHQSGQSVVGEKTRWMVYVGAVGLNGATRIPCVANKRNLSVPWTVRYDDELPDAIIGRGYAFAPPAEWWKRRTVAVGVHAGKMSWVDSTGNYWSSPNTPGRPYHWDVHFRNTADSPNGLSPCNIVRWGVPSTEGSPGAVHHVPAVKRSRAQG
jgi:hypothetical protein